MRVYGGTSGATSTPALATFTPVVPSLTNWTYDSRTGCFRQGPTSWSDVADAKSNPPSLYTVVNSGSVSSAAISSGRLQLVNTGTGVYFGGTSTAGHFKRTTSFDVRRARYERIYRIDFSNTVGTTYAFWFLTSNASGRLAVGTDVFYDGVNYKARYLLNDSTFADIVTLSAGQNTAGVWFRVTVTDGLYVIDYNRTLGGTTAPTESQWTHAVAVAISPSAAGSVYGAGTATEVFGARVDNGTNAAGFVFASERVGDPVVGAAKPYVAVNTGGFATGSQDFVLYDDVYVSTSMSDATLVAALETRLAAITNALPGDVATWSAKIERSATAGSYSGGSFATLGSLSASGSGAWVRVTMRSVAASAAAGSSVDLRRAAFSVPVS